MTRRAFTLFEVLLALALTLVLSGSVMTFLWQLYDDRDRLLSESEAQESSDLLFERLERDLLTSIAGTDRHGSGFVGTTDSITLLWRGVDLAGAYESGTTPAADLLRSAYRFDETSRSLTFASGSPDGSLTAEEITTRFERVRFRYSNGRAWRDSFDASEQGGFPVAIEVAVWFAPWDEAAPGAASKISDLRSERDPLALEDGGDFGEFGSAFDEDPLAMDPFEADEATATPPDRVRIIALPDAAWPEGATP